MNIKNSIQTCLAVIISLAFSLGVAELVAFYKIEGIKKQYQDSSSELAKKYLSDDITNFRIKYENRLDHLRSYHDLKDDAPATELLFTTISPYQKGRPNVLLQGDSWANNASSSKIIKEEIRDFSKRKKIGFVAAGVGSYSPSPMLVQLRTLRDEFNFYPSIIVAIIDQTDIGDELDRYSDSILNVEKNIIQMRPQDFESLNHNGLLRARNAINLYSNEFSILKLIKYAEFKQHENSLPHWGVHVLDPLYKNIDERQKKIVIKNISAYISEVFRDADAKRLIIITHPHKKHLNGPDRYKLNVADLVNESVLGSSRKADIYHLNFSNNFYDLYSKMKLEEVFLKDDPSSHLSEVAYSCCFYPAILNRIDMTLREMK